VAEDDERRRVPVRPDVVRAAVDQAFQAGVGQGGRAVGSAQERAQELVDELAHAAGRVREALDDLRPPTADDVRALRAELGALERRVAALEDAARPPA
jgi:hypothetical protein